MPKLRDTRDTSMSFMFKINILRFKEYWKKFKKLIGKDQGGDSDV